MSVPPMEDTEKLRCWWSEDGKWFCLIAKSGPHEVTVSLDEDEALTLGNALVNRPKKKLETVS